MSSINDINNQNDVISTTTVSKPKHHWIIVIIVFLFIFIAIIIGIVIWQSMSSSDSKTPICTGDSTSVDSYSEETASVAPLLVSGTDNISTPNYLTNNGSITQGSTKNDQIKTKNATGWILINQSTDIININFYAYNETNNIVKISSSNLESSGNLVWNQNDNNDKPLFPGMSINITNVTNTTQQQPNTISNIYVVPNNLNPKKDIVVLTYQNTDGNTNSLSGNVCRPIN